MRYLIFIAVVLMACGNAVVNSKPADAVKNNGSFEPVAVIELFTSQGCSSCPPADALLGKTIKDATNDKRKIFALSFHVDYWNRLGWTDPFSSAAFSQRQNEYVSSLGLNGAYTPQMIVNGTGEFVGSDKAALTASLNNALKTAAEINFSSLTVAYNNENIIKVHYVLEGAIKGATINFALVSLSETTVVKRGENGGRTLTHDNVVRQLVKKDAAAAAAGDIQFADTPVPVKDNAAVIAFVQQEKSFKIIGAAMAKIN